MGGGSLFQLIRQNVRLMYLLDGTVIAFRSC
jgi:hypothetical protein